MKIEEFLEMNGPGNKLVGFKVRIETSHNCVIKGNFIGTYENGLLCEDEISRIPSPTPYELIKNIDVFYSNPFTTEGLGFPICRTNKPVNNLSEAGKVANRYYPPKYGNFQVNWIPIDLTISFDNETYKPSQGPLKLDITVSKADKFLQENSKNISTKRLKVTCDSGTTYCGKLKGSYLLDYLMIVDDSKGLQVLDKGKITDIRFEEDNSSIGAIADIFSGSLIADSKKLSENEGLFNWREVSKSENLGNFSGIDTYLEQSSNSSWCTLDEYATSASPDQIYKDWLDVLKFLPKSWEEMPVNDFMYPRAYPVMTDNYKEKRCGFSCLINYYGTGITYELARPITDYKISGSLDLDNNEGDAEMQTLITKETTEMTVKIPWPGADKDNIKVHTDTSDRRIIVTLPPAFGSNLKDPVKKAYYVEDRYDLDTTKLSVSAGVVTVIVSVAKGVVTEVLPE